MLIDMAVPSESDTSAKFIEKLSRHKDLEIEFNRMWDMKTETEAMRARGIIVLVKLVGQKYQESKNFSWLKLDFNRFWPPKSRRLSLLVGYTNQNTALIIDH